MNVHQGYQEKNEVIYHIYSSGLMFKIRNLKILLFRGSLINEFPEVSASG